MSRGAGVGVLLLGTLTLLAVAAGVGAVAGGEHFRAAIAGCGLAVVAGLFTLVGDRPLARRVGPVVAYGVAAGVRGLFGLGGGLVLAARFPGPDAVFWGWVLAAYLVGLVLETAVLTRSGRVSRRGS